MWSALIDNIRIRSLSIGLVVVEICPLSYFHHRTSCVKNKNKFVSMAQQVLDLIPPKKFLNEVWGVTFFWLCHFGYDDIESRQKLKP